MNADKRGFRTRKKAARAVKGYTSLCSAWMVKANAGRHKPSLTGRLSTPVHSMKLDYFITRLSLNRGVFESLLRGVADGQAVWKPAPDKWSMLEVVNHLDDEEREDFRARLELTLRDPAQAWPAIDPQGWVVTRKYSERELGASLDSFLSEREKSLSWLKGLSAPAWENRHEVSGRSRTAGDLMASWLAHDFLHIRQLTRLHWQYIGVIAAPYETAYGGPWQET